jgi:hypothetical protein
MTDQFVIGEVYFRITYPGPSLKYPQIESLVFVGKNLSDEDTEDTWYFQFADSYAKSGSILESPGGDRRVVCVERDGLHEIFNEDQLLEKLRAARQRRTNGP